MYCSKCRKKSNSTTNFCTDCGNKLRKIKILYEDIHEGIQLKPKKISYFLYILLSLFLVIFMCFLWFFVESTVDTSLPVIYFRRSNIEVNTFLALYVTRITCWIGILGGIWGFVLFIKIIIENKPIIIVNQNGISNGRYFIAWDNIENIEIVVHGNKSYDKFVRIHLKQPLKKHSFIYLSLISTGIKYEDFLQQVLEYKELIGK